MAINNVTAGSIKTPTLSADQIMIGEETLAEYIARLSKGSTVTPELTSGVKIATIAGGGVETDLYAPEGGNKEYSAFEVFPTNVDILSTDNVFDKVTLFYDDLPKATKELFDKYAKLHIAKSGNKRYIITSYVEDSETKYKWEETVQKSVDEVFDFDNSEHATGFKYNYDVPADMTMMFTLVMSNQEFDDMTIDFGDGILKSMSELDEEGAVVTKTKDSYYPPTYKYVVTHTYDNPGKYIVKINGKHFGFNSGNDSSGEHSLISRVWDVDLPVHHCAWNMSALCQSSLRILKVNIPTHNFQWPADPLNIYHAFHTCKNLVEFTNGRVFFPKIKIMCNMFMHCLSLKKLSWCVEDYQGMPTAEFAEYEAMYNDCPSLETPLMKLLPIIPTNRFVTGWHSDEVDLMGMFNGCTSIPAMSSADAVAVGRLLWNNTHYNYKVRQDVKNLFSTCSTALRAQIPTSWGGTKA